MYCSPSAFAARFSSTELDQLLPDSDDRGYAVAAADADALIDSHLAARYAVPFATPPALIVSIAADLTRYELYEEAPTKEVTERRKLAIGLLEQLRDGTLSLPGAASVTSPMIAVQSREQVFTEDLGCHIVGRL